MRGRREAEERKGSRLVPHIARNWILDTLCLLFLLRLIQKERKGSRLAPHIVRNWIRDTLCPAKNISHIFYIWFRRRPQANIEPSCREEDFDREERTDDYKRWLAAV